MTGNEIRKQFLDYFIKHNHQAVRSASLVPSDDPTLLFTNAGMVPFKRVFLGEDVRQYSRATTSQKCVRAGGKHNDLENVGYTARHHTFFEMLGNFSFGDYFKEKAIEFAWDLLLNGYGLPVDKLYVSVFQDDDEAYNIWHDQMGVDKEMIVRLGEKDNFWSMGDTGPCGPCSEILIDRGAQFGCNEPDCQPGCDCDRYLEIWNLVFMQYNRNSQGEMTPLPKPSIDTGMGLERIVSVLQDTPTNYETDLMMPIIKTVEELSNKSVNKSHEVAVAMKVIADHSRAAAFLIGDGVMPSNEGRGYVLRRIMRRAIRYGRNIGLTQPFLHHTAKMVFNIMESAYPELQEAEAYITNVIENEEVRFFETLDTGLKLLNDTIANLKAKNITEIPGDIMFKLYDTFGFPTDIIRDVCLVEKMTMDSTGFNDHMERQRAQSRSKVSFTQMSEAYKNLSTQGVKSEFVGYDQFMGEARVLLIVKDGQETNQCQPGDEVEIVVDKTPFYGAAGGQVGDIGLIKNINDDEQLEAQIGDTLKDPTGLIIHKTQILKGILKKNETIWMQVDLNHRGDIAKNHTATHILHTSLKNILGDHVKQAGSLVAADRLRFDFSHFSLVDQDTLNQVETLVNQHIVENVSVSVEEMDADQALKSGATALFEEKYGDRVRVISLAEFSKELCGGTHVGRTGDIGFFKIISETSVAAGVRRIEACTGSSALAYVQTNLDILNAAAQHLKEKVETVPERVKKLLQNQKSLEKEIEALKVKMASKSVDSMDDDVKEINGTKVVVKEVAIENPKALRELADKFKDKIQSGVVVLGAKSGKKAMLIAIVTQDLTKKYHAGNIVKQIAPVVGGGGGGRPDMAQAGGSKPDLIGKALEKVFAIIQ